MKNIIAGLMLLGFSCQLWADSALQLKERMDAVSSMRGEFTQVLSDQQGDAIQSSKGTFTLKRPGFFYWETYPPFEQVVVGTPEKVWVYDPDLEQVTIRKSDLSNSPAAIISGNLEGLKNTYSIQQNKAESGDVFTLSPLNPDSNYEQIQLAFGPAHLTSLMFMDKLKQKTVIEFTQVKENLKVEDAFFQFSIPEGADVVVDE